MKKTIDRTDTDEQTSARIFLAGVGDKFFLFIRWCLFRPYDEFVASILGVRYAKFRVRPMWFYILGVLISVLMGLYRLEILRLLQSMSTPLQ